MKKPILAIMYDFDKTLSTTDMQNYSFIPNLGLTPEEFWGMTGEFTAKTGCERILAYMYMMVKLCKDKGIKLTKQYLNDLGKNITYFPGVDTWFQRINDYGKKWGVKVEHYLVSSGTKEIVDGSSIAKEFTKIYACEYYYDPETGEAVWPKLAINYTQKTQYFFRITKGVTDAKNDTAINLKVLSKRIPYENMVYIGDGMTDVPCMTLVKEKGGNTIAIYKKAEKSLLSLCAQGRVNYAFKGNYTEKSDIEKTMHLLIKRIAINNELTGKSKSVKKFAEKEDKVNG